MAHSESNRGLQGMDTCQTLGNVSRLPLEPQKSLSVFAEVRDIKKPKCYETESTLTDLFH